MQSNRLLVMPCQPQYPQVPLQHIRHIVTIITTAVIVIVTAMVITVQSHPYHRHMSTGESVAKAKGVENTNTRRR